MEEATQLTKEQTGHILAALLNYVLDLEDNMKRLEILDLIDLIRHRR